MDRDTLWRVSTGSAEFAISIAPRVSAPNSNRVTVARLPPLVRPASAAARYSVW
jgi:hypothetical protein